MILNEEKDVLKQMYSGRMVSQLEKVDIQESVKPFFVKSSTVEGLIKSGKIRVYKGEDDIIRPYCPPREVTPVQPDPTPSELASNSQVPSEVAPGRPEVEVLPFGALKVLHFGPGGGTHFPKELDS